MITLTAYAQQKIAVFGLGKAGEAAVASLLAGEAEVFAWDDKASPLEKKGLRQIPYADWPWAELTALVLSPGIPLTHPKPHPVVEIANRHNVPVIGEVELLYRAQPDAMYIGITGTNGKSTTTSLIAHILSETGYEVQVGGNLGVPALALEPLDEDGIYVLEMSSYQLDLCQTVRFDIAVLLNFTPDHLDRHGDMAGYIAAKKRIFNNHDLPPEDEWSRGVAVIAVDDKDTVALADDIAKNPYLDLVRVSAQKVVDDGVYVTQGQLQDHIPDVIVPAEQAMIDLRHIPTLPGRHNWQNAAAAYAAARICGVTPEEAQAAMHSFPGLRHRLQLVATIQGVRFINDSKATNADATANALAPYEPIYWILGGKPKAGGITSLEGYFPKIAHAFLIGQAAEEFAQTLEGNVAYTQCGTLAVAVEKAAAMAFAEKKAGAVVLLSPACASWDQWKSFEERGDAFCAMVEKIS